MRNTYKHSHKNLFVILTFQCNQNCNFCLFRFNKIKECKENIIVSKVEKILSENTEIMFSVKLTGGEPFLKPSLLIKLIKKCGEFKNIRDIGIGTNGTVTIVAEMEKTSHKTNIYFSRHGVDTEWGEIKNIKFKNPLIEKRLNCNLIKGGIDNLDKVLKYILWAKEQGIKFICFRELNNLHINNRNMYPQFIYDYFEYYKSNLVKITSIMSKIDKYLSYDRTVSNGYDTNYVYHDDEIKVLFRKIDESRLLSFNKKNPGIDEYVVHPDSLVTGCWDRDLKVLNI